jgi:peptide chain release factor 2
MADPGFWNDQEKAREIINEVNQLKGWVDPWLQMSAKVDDLREMLELLEADPDEGMAEEVERDVRGIGPALEALELKNMLQQPDDHRHSGPFDR